MLLLGMIIKSWKDHDRMTLHTLKPAMENLDVSHSSLGSQTLYFRLSLGLDALITTLWKDISDLPR